MLTFFSCANKTERASDMDSMNAVGNSPALDTVVDTLPNGYAPPNDSVNSANHHLDSTLH